MYIVTQYFENTLDRMQHVFYTDNLTQAEALAEELSEESGNTWLILYVESQIQGTTLEDDTSFDEYFEVRKGLDYPKTFSL